MQFRDDHAVNVLRVLFWVLVCLLLESLKLLHPALIHEDEAVESWDMHLDDLHESSGVLLLRKQA